VKNSLYRAMLCALVLSLAACGPGTGGTGGDSADYLWLAGAKATSVCTAPFQGLLVCPAGPSASEDRQGTKSIQYASATPDADMLLSFDTSKVVLQRGCPKLDYSGEFGVLPNGEGMFFGSYTSTGQVEHVAANLSVKAGTGAAADQLVMELRATDGRLLLGPVMLKRVEAPRQAPLAC